MNECIFVISLLISYVLFFLMYIWTAVKPSKCHQPVQTKKPIGHLGRAGDVLLIAAISLMLMGPWSFPIAQAWHGANRTGKDVHHASSHKSLPEKQRTPKSARVAVCHKTKLQAQPKPLEQSPPTSPFRSPNLRCSHKPRCARRPCAWAKPLALTIESPRKRHRGTSPPREVEVGWAQAPCGERSRSWGGETRVDATMCIYIYILYIPYIDIYIYMIIIYC